jgi:hypothetical protein
MMRGLTAESGTIPALSSVTDPITYLSRTMVWASSDRTVTGPASASTLLTLLNGGSFLHEYSLFNWREQSYLPGSVLYTGFVNQIDPDPVPEPTTIALLATGLLAIRIRRHSTRGTNRV